MLLLVTSSCVGFVVFFASSHDRAPSYLLGPQALEWSPLTLRVREGQEGLWSSARHASIGSVPPERAPSTAARRVREPPTTLGRLYTTLYDPTPATSPKTSKSPRSVTRVKFSPRVRVGTSKWNGRLSGAPRSRG